MYLDWQKNWSSLILYRSAYLGSQVKSHLKASFAHYCDITKRKKNSTTWSSFVCSMPWDCGVVSWTAKPVLAHIQVHNLRPFTNSMCKHENKKNSDLLIILTWLSILSASLLLSHAYRKNEVRRSNKFIYDQVRRKNQSPQIDCLKLLS